MLYQVLYRSKVSAFTKLYSARRFVPLLKKHEVFGSRHKPELVLKLQKPELDCKQQKLELIGKWH